MNPVSLFILACIGIVTLLWIRSLSPNKRLAAVILVIFTCLALFTLLLALTGRLHWLAAVFAGLLPFSRYFLPVVIKVLPFLGRWFYKKKSSQTKQGNASEVNTRIIKMKLDHDSGQMSGRVSEGPFASRELSTLSEAEFIELLQYCREKDQDSTRLLEAYLDKRFGQSWRADDPERDENHTEESYSNEAPPNTPPNRSNLSLTDAYNILSLKPGCTKEEVITAHRRLMQKLHPDRGGSDYIAAKINEAKSILLATF